MSERSVTKDDLRRLPLYREMEERVEAAERERDRLYAEVERLCSQEESDFFRESGEQFYAERDTARSQATHYKEALEKIRNMPCTAQLTDEQIRAAREDGDESLCGPFHAACALANDKGGESGLHHLAGEAVESMKEREGEDIEEWADRIADDVSGADD